MLIGIFSMLYLADVTAYESSNGSTTNNALLLIENNNELKGL